MFLEYNSIDSNSGSIISSYFLLADIKAIRAEFQEGKEKLSISIIVYEQRLEIELSQMNFNILKHLIIAARENYKKYMGAVFQGWKEQNEYQLDSFELTLDYEEVSVKMINYEQERARMETINRAKEKIGKKDD